MPYLCGSYNKKTTSNTPAQEDKVGKEIMMEDNVRIIQDTENANFVYVVRDKEARDGVRMYSRKYMLRELRGGSAWRVQLMEPDGTYNPDSHIFYEGNNAEEVLRQLVPNWGVWAITEIMDPEENELFSVFGKFNPSQYAISLNQIL